MLYRNIFFNIFILKKVNYKNFYSGNEKNKNHDTTKVLKRQR